MWPEWLDLQVMNSTANVAHSKHMLLVCMLNGAPRPGFVKPKSFFEHGGSRAFVLEVDIVGVRFILFHARFSKLSQ